MIDLSTAWAFSFLFYAFLIHERVDVVCYSCSPMHHFLSCNNLLVMIYGHDIEIPPAFSTLHQSL
jgi:hypothetical protein